MLQQTTVQTVVPFFERFIKRFPTVASLAKAPLADVLEYWAGLGYYSRAKNLHKAAQALSKMNYFPQTYKELINLSGFGEYTSRAVASIAFDQPVGVVDGNVIRVISRLLGKAFVWWKTIERSQIQAFVDQLCQIGEPGTTNQALMELGATICTPQSPSCNLCPWCQNCVARTQDQTQHLPLKRPRKSKVLLSVEMTLLFCQDEIALIENTSLPILKNTLLPPAKVKILTKKPSHFHFQHAVTHHQIFIHIETKVVKIKSSQYQWHSVHALAKVNPSSLLKKSLAHAQDQKR